MKKIMSILLMFLIMFSTLAMFSPTVNSQGTPEQLTTNPYKDGQPSWSPDGTKIVYNAFSDSWHRHIWVMNSNGSGKTQLTFGNIVDSYPVFSPDGTKIAFARYGFRGDRFDLMVMNADGTGIIRLTDSGIPGMVEGTYEELEWSKDGSKLVFSYGEGTTGQYKPWWVCTVDFIAGDIDEGDINPIVRGFNPVFCYDDTKILFTHSVDPYFGDQQIAMINADGTGDVDYLTAGPTDYEPDISPLNDRIVFTRGWEVGDLYLMDADGSSLNLLLSNGDRNYMASWSPDGEYIAYASGVVGVDYDIWKIQVQLSVDGIETVVTFEGIRLRFPWLFTIQQNFWIQGGDHLYWAQNIILTFIHPLPWGTSRMIGLFEVYNFTVPNQPGIPVKRNWWPIDSIGMGLAKNTVTMTSIIENNQLVMTNDFSSYSWQIPTEAVEDCHIVVSAQLPDRSVVGGFQPEIVLVGPYSNWPHVNFLEGTDGHVDTYLRIASTGTWVPGVNSVIESSDGSTTGETSSGLNWTSTGDFEYVEGSTDQGLNFVPV